MNAEELKKSYCLEPKHMPQPNGLNVVEIFSVSEETFSGLENGQPAMKTRTNLWFVGVPLPLRLNNTRIDLLVAILGGETDGWRGRRIGLQIVGASSYGKTKIELNIAIQPCDGMECTAGVGTPRIRPGLAAPPPGAIGLPPGGRAPGQAAAAGPGFGIAADRSPMGADTAAQICSELRARNKTWDDLIAFLRGRNLLHLAAGPQPPECPIALVAQARDFCRDHPRVKAPATPSELAAIKAGWQPQAPHAPTEVIDRKTGVVMRPTGPAPASPVEPADLPPEDDIPF